MLAKFIAIILVLVFTLGLCTTIIPGDIFIHPTIKVNKTTQKVRKISIVEQAINATADYHHMDRKVLYTLVGMESGLNPNLIIINRHEHSIGLLQVNIKTNWDKDDGNPKQLLDPLFNLTYQSRELKYYYDKGMNRGLTDKNLVEYVSKYGQRADWKNSENVKNMRENIEEYWEKASYIESKEIWDRLIFFIRT